MLAATGGAVILVAADGTPKQIVKLSQEAPAERAVLASTGGAFGVLQGKKLHVRDAAGDSLYSASVGASDAVRLWPDGKAYVDPVVEGDDPEHGEAREVRVGDKVATEAFDAKGLRATRPAGDYLFYRTDAEIRKVDRKGAPIWSAQVPARLFEPDAAGRWLVVARRDDVRKVAIYDDQNVVGSTSLEGPVWNVAIAPGGKFAAANSKGKLVVFADGKLAGSAQLGGGRPVALAVSDKGDVLVGYQDPAKKISLVIGFDSKGTQRWQIEVPHGKQAYRPDPRFFPDSKGFVVRHEAGLGAYRLPEGG